MKSSQREILLDVTEEDGDQNYYLKYEQHWSWPGGSSGPTVGVGFDCGYESAASIRTVATVQYGNAKVHYCLFVNQP